MQKIAQLASSKNMPYYTYSEDEWNKYIIINQQI
ncbi:hypothetical protein BDD26_3712 [Xenorhabdus cabanillasii]|uniref:Uncharacterized protein n=1 Tax=Xenorhabdus cabanillasii TaxID=351673 RepID=A0A3D9ULB3_9GAMM|nr:hypothetical protein BDD26_3712 [Xenorhabdus cabanillasii]